MIGLADDALCQAGVAVASRAAAPAKAGELSLAHVARRRLAASSRAPPVLRASETLTGVVGWCAS